MFETTTENGKYKFINDGGVPKVYRYGELQEQGSKAWLTLLQKVEQLEKENKDLKANQFEYIEDAPLKYKYFKDNPIKE